MTKFPPKNLLQDLRQMGHIDIINMQTLMNILQKIPSVSDANPNFITLTGELPLAKDADAVDKKIKTNAKKQLDKEFK